MSQTYFKYLMTGYVTNIFQGMPHVTCHMSWYVTNIFQGMPSVVPLDVTWCDDWQGGGERQMTDCGLKMTKWGEDRGLSQGRKWKYTPLAWTRGEYKIYTPEPWVNIKYTPLGRGEYKIYTPGQGCIQNIHSWAGPQTRRGGWSVLL